MNTDELWKELQAADNAAAVTVAKRVADRAGVTNAPVGGAAFGALSTATTSSLGGIPPNRTATVDSIMRGTIRRDDKQSPVALAAIAKQAKAKAFALVAGQSVGAPNSIAPMAGTSAAAAPSAPAADTLRQANAIASVNAASSEVKDSSKSVSGTLAHISTFADVSALRSALSRDIQGSNDDNMVVRRTSLQRISIALFGRDLGDADDSTRIITLAAAVSGVGGNSSVAAGADAATSAAAALTATSHVSAVSSSALVPAGLSETVLTMDPAYIYHSHELSDVARMITGRDVSGRKAKGVVPSAAGPSASSPVTNSDGARQLPSVEIQSASRVIAATTMTNAIAFAMRSDPMGPLLGNSTASNHDGESDNVGTAPAVGQGSAASGAAQRGYGGDSDDEDEPSITGSMQHASNGQSDGQQASQPPAASAAGNEEAGRVRGLLQAIWPELQKPLLRRFSDPHEACRLTAIGMVSAFLTVIRDIGPALPYLIPALVDRCAGTWCFDPSQKIFAKDVASIEAYQRGRVVASTQGVLAASERDIHTQKVSEPSEAGRMLLARLLFCLVNTAIKEGSLPLLDSYLHEIIMCSHALASDPSPDLRVIAAPLILELADAAPEALKHYAVALIRSLMIGGLDHRHAKVRLATLDILDCLITMEDEAKGRGAGSEGLQHLLGSRDANIVPVSSFYQRDTTINFFAKLVVDGNPSVRLRFVHALGNWMTRLSDKHEWWSRLLPYLLSCYSDQAPGIAQACMEYIEACAINHEAENGKMVMEKRQFGLDGDPDVDYTRPLPTPFSGRPRIGARLFVRANCPRFLKPILAELADWQPFALPNGGTPGEVRARAAALLCTVLVYQEEMATQDVDSLVHTLVSCIHDPDVHKQIRVAARLIGRFLPPQAWIDVLIPIISGDTPVKTGGAAVSTETGLMAASLHVLWLAAAECRPGRLLPHVHRILQQLTSQRVLQLTTVVHSGSDAAERASLFQTRVARGLRQASRSASASDAGGGAQQQHDNDNSDGAAPASGDGSMTSVAATALAKLRAANGGGANSAGSGSILANGGNDGDEGTIPGRFAARQHVLACLALCSNVLSGRLQSMAGASFDRTGRLAGPHATVTSMVRTLLTIRGHIAISSIEGKSPGWMVGQSASEPATSADDRWKLPSFGYRDVTSPVLAFESAGFGMPQAASGSAAIKQQAQYRAGDLVDAILVQLAKVAGANAAAAAASTQAVDSSTGDRDLPAPALALIAGRHEQLLLACMTDYPADSGWSLSSHAHALLTQLLAPSLATSHPEVVAAALPMTVDLGSSLLAASPDMEDAATIAHSSSSKGAAASKTSIRKFGVSGFLLRASVPRWSEAVGEWLRLLAAIIALSPSPSNVVHKALSQSSLLESLINNVLAHDVPAGSSSQLADGSTVTVQASQYGALSKAEAEPELFVLAAACIAGLAPALATAVEQCTSRSSNSKAYYGTAVAATIKILPAFLLSAGKQSAHYLAAGHRARVLDAVASLIPLVPLAGPAPVPVADAARAESGDGAAGAYNLSQLEITGSILHAISAYAMDDSLVLRKSGSEALRVWLSQFQELVASAPVGSQQISASGAPVINVAPALFATLRALGPLTGSLSGSGIALADDVAATGADDAAASGIVVAGDAGSTSGTSLPPVDPSSGRIKIGVNLRAALEETDADSGSGAGAVDSAGGAGDAADASWPHPSLADEVLGFLMQLATSPVHAPLVASAATAVLTASGHSGAASGTGDGAHVCSAVAQAVLDHIEFLRSLGRGS